MQTYVCAHIVVYAYIHTHSRVVEGIGNWIWIGHSTQHHTASILSLTGLYRTGPDHGAGIKTELWMRFMTIFHFLLKLDHENQPTRVTLRYRYSTGSNRTPPLIFAECRLVSFVDT